MSDTPRPYQEDPIQHLVKFELAIGRPFVRATLTDQCSAGGIAFNYQYGAIWFGIVPVGAGVQTVTASCPGVGEDDPSQSITIVPFSYPDMTPGALENALASIDPNTLPFGTRQYVLVTDFTSDFPYSGMALEFNAAGGVLRGTFFNSDLQNYAVTVFDPPRYPLFS